MESRARSLAVSLRSFVVFVCVCVRVCVLLVSLPSLFVRVRSADIVRRCVPFPLSRSLVPFPLCRLSFRGYISVATFIFLAFFLVKLVWLFVVCFLFLWVRLRCAARVFVSTLPVRLCPLFLAYFFSVVAV